MSWWVFTVWLFLGYPTSAPAEITVKILDQEICEYVRQNFGEPVRGWNVVKIDPACKKQQETNDKTDV